MALHLASAPCLVALGVRMFDLYLLASGLVLVLDRRFLFPDH